MRPQFNNHSAVRPYLKVEIYREPSETVPDFSTGFSLGIRIIYGFIQT